MSVLPPSAHTSSAVLEDLVVRAANGDAEAQSLLLMRYRYFIRRAVRTRLGSAVRLREATSDLEQNVALELLRSMAGYAWQGRSAFLTWLRRLVQHQVIDVARYHGAQRRDPANEKTLDSKIGAPAQRSPESLFDGQQRLAELERLLDELPAAQAQAVVLFSQGHSHAEIGEALGTSAEAARKHIARGRAKLALLAARR